MGRVVVLGSLNIDLVARVSRLPVAGETLLGSELQRRPGGKGANQALAAADAGAEVLLVGRVGADDDGPRYLRALAERGVDVSQVSVDATADTGHAVVLVDDDGENLIVVVAGANATLSGDDLAAVGLRPNDVVLLQLEISVAAAERAIELGRTAGATVIINLSPYQRLDDDVLAACDVVIVNEVEAAELPDGGVDPDRLVVTRGADGASWGTTEVAARRVRVVDTTGAGDAFAGALAAALALGMPRDQALAAAIAAGASCVTHRGAQPWLL